MIVLGIESSCDDTGAAVVTDEKEILGEALQSQEEHKRYGGVVPEIAARAHLEHVDDIVSACLERAHISLNDIDAVAASSGPGLIGGVVVGVMTAKALALALNKPFVAVNHLEGHALCARLVHPIEFPYLLLLVSGGHCQILVVKDVGEYERLGTTIDDAAGEAFDKVARVLGLEYPGGPNIERLAREGKPVVELPAMLKGKDCYDFSYSGLKTAVINYVHNHEQTGAEYSKADLACSFQHAAVDVLVKKAIKAAKERGLKVITAGGGVVANGYLRDTLSSECADNGLIAVLPPKKMCTDNAAMIAAEGYLRYKAGDFADMTLNAKARVDLA